MAGTRAGGAGAPRRGGAPRQADVFAIFGITGDLAKVMTFHSLYRLEQRGLLDCPIVGVAVDDWTVDQLVQRARESIVGTGETLDEETFARLAARFSYVQGNFGDPAVFDFGPPALLPNAVRNSASLKRGTIAPGSTFRVDTFNLTATADYSPTPLPVLAGVRMRGCETSRAGLCPFR